MPISSLYQHFCLSALLLLLWTTVSEQGVTERRLLKTLFQKQRYNKLERPVYNESDPLVVQFGLTLQQIIDVDEKNQILISNIWLNLVWFDYSLTWNESEYDGIKSIRVPPTDIWKPDIYMYNSADEDVDSAFPTNVVVSSDGKCQWVPPGLFLSTCKINIKWFPFDDQECRMKFGSWTYDSSGIDLQPSGDSGDISTFQTNGEWVLLGVPAERNTKKYDCCPEQYVDVTFKVLIQRRKLYYVFNLVVPCLMMSCLSLLVFAMPPDAGEKITCGVTILLSLTVFLQLVAETMPPTSDALPLIGMYFASIMMMCSLSMVFTVLVLNYHHRTPDTHHMPPWVKKIICQWLARIVRIQRPVQSPPVSCSAGPTTPGGSTPTSRLTRKASQVTSQLLQQRSSRSLLANVLDLEDDLLLLRNISGGGIKAEANPPFAPQMGGLPYGGVGDMDAPLWLTSTGAGVGGGKDGAIKLDRDMGTVRVDQSTGRRAPGGLGWKTESRTLKGMNVQNFPASAPAPSAAGFSRQQLNGNVPAAAAASANNYSMTASSSRYSFPASLSSLAQDGSHGNIPGTTQETVVMAAAAKAAASAAAAVSAPLNYNIISTPVPPSTGEDAQCELLVDILSEVQYLTTRLNREVEMQQVCNDWKFAAMVIDRMCLWLFSFFTIVSTSAILFSAPHTVV